MWYSSEQKERRQRQSNDSELPVSVSCASALFGFVFLSVSSDLKASLADRSRELGEAPKGNEEERVRHCYEECYGCGVHV